MKMAFISESSKKIQDSLYYQDYSYVVKVSESINKWRDALKRAVHPSGFYVTGEVNIATQLSCSSKTTCWFYNLWWIILRHFRQSNLHEIEYSIQLQSLVEEQVLLLVVHLVALN